MGIIIENLVPVFALIALGHVLGRIGFVSPAFYKGADRIVYFILFPVMLFWKVGGSNAAVSINWKLTLSVLAIITTGYLLSIAYVHMSGMGSFQVGAFSQCSYRFNTYIGMAVVLSTLGEEGVKDFGILISVLIPYINVLAVSTLLWYAKKDFSFKEKAILLIKALIANPLIIGCLLGLAYSFLQWPLPAFFNNTFSLLSVSALPLALLSVGNALTLQVVKGNLTAALICSMIKLGFLPISGYLILRLLNLPELSFKVGLIFLALPTSVASYILSSQLNSDPNMASACIVLTTLLSFFSLSAVLVL